MNDASLQRRWTPPRSLLIALSLLIVGLNAFDGYATLRACRTLGAVELNPVMAALLSAGPWAFMTAKTLGVAAAILLLGYCLHHVRVRDSVRKAGWGGLIALNVVYAALTAWHLLVITGAIVPPEMGSAESKPALIGPVFLFRKWGGRGYGSSSFCQRFSRGMVAVASSLAFSPGRWSTRVMWLTDLSIMSFMLSCGSTKAPPA